jgi:hypothetical protein
MPSMAEPTRTEAEPDAELDDELWSEPIEDLLDETLLLDDLADVACGVVVDEDSDEHGDYAIIERPGEPD